MSCYKVIFFVKYLLFYISNAELAQDCNTILIKSNM